MFETFRLMLIMGRNGVEVQICSRHSAFPPSRPWSTLVNRDIVVGSDFGYLSLVAAFG
jgi:hypothetical protein